MKKNEQTLRPEKVFLHDISKPKDLDTLIYFEEDETFSVYVNESKSKEYIFLASYSTLTSEYQFIKSSEPFSDFKLIQKRTRGLEYSVSHFKDKFYRKSLMGSWSSHYKSWKNYNRFMER